jgi:restriction system protein
MSNQVIRPPGIASMAVVGHAPKVTVTAPPHQPALPDLTLKALLQFGENGKEGRLVEAVAWPWYEILKIFEKDLQGIYQIDARKWEEIIAGAYTAAGFDEVVLTPRSGDFGRDVIAIKKGFGSVRIFDQVKAYAPHRHVTAQEVQAMLGVITSEPNVSKGVITTTASFAPNLMDNPHIRAQVPYRLELKARDELLKWLGQLNPAALPQRS